MEKKKNKIIIEIDGHEKGLASESFFKAKPGNSWRLQLGLFG